MHWPQLTHVYITIIQASTPAKDTSPRGSIRNLAEIWQTRVKAPATMAACRKNKMLQEDQVASQRVESMLGKPLISGPVPMSPPALPLPQLSRMAVGSSRLSNLEAIRSKPSLQAQSNLLMANQHTANQRTGTNQRTGSPRRQSNHSQLSRMDNHRPMAPPGTSLQDQPTPTKAVYQE